MSKKKQKKTIKDAIPEEIGIYCLKASGVELEELIMHRPKVWSELVCGQEIKGEDIELPISGNKYVLLPNVENEADREIVVKTLSFLESAIRESGGRTFRNVDDNLRWCATKLSFDAIDILGQKCMELAMMTTDTKCIEEV